MDIIDIPMAAVAKEFGRLMDLYYGFSANSAAEPLNFGNLAAARWRTNDFVSTQGALIHAIEEIWLEYPDERVAFETKLKLGVKF